jgi:hypothetical protein
MIDKCRKTKRGAIDSNFPSGKIKIDGNSSPYAASCCRKYFEIPGCKKSFFFLLPCFLFILLSPLSPLVVLKIEAQPGRLALRASQSRWAFRNSKDSF